MSRPAALLQRLSGIDQKLHDPKFVELLVMGRSNDDVTVEHVTTALEKVLDALRDIIHRELPQIESSIRGHESRMASMPRGQLSSDADRLRQLKFDFEAARRMSNELLKLAESLRQRNDPNLLQRSKDLKEIAEAGEKAFGHNNIELQQALESILAPGIYAPRLEPNSGASLIPSLIFLFVVVRQLKDKWKGEK